jgi:TolB-like protein/DNA-binding winged helix-turn-helix (wHTH) protein/Tfp pilus assembly protein PilF
MKCSQSFRLDSANHCLWRGEERVAMAPKPYDVLRYLVENPGRLVTHDEILENLWRESYVNPELIRKYIVDIRKTLGDRPDKPEFIETVTKRGYRFIAPVIDDESGPAEEIAVATQVEPAPGVLASEPGESSRPHDLPPHDLRPHDLRSHYLRKVAILMVLAVVIAAAAAAGHFWFGRNRSTAVSLHTSSIAVLPFADLSPGKDQEYFSDGLSEQLINDLAEVPGLKVVGRSSAFQFEGKHEDPREAGRKLGVTNVLEGSVRREGNHVRITAELIKADDGVQLWSQTYDREINDIFAVQDDIAEAATAALQLKLLGSNGQPIATTWRSSNPQAYQAYLQAEYFIGRGRGKEELVKALAYSDQAIKLDDKYAPAWALRARVRNTMAEVELTEVTEGYRKARDDAEQAIALDPGSASGYLALATNQIDNDWDWDAANTFLTKAATLQPGGTEVFRVRSNLFWVLGNLDQAIRLRQQEVALDPLRADSFIDLGYLLYVAGRYDESRAELKKALDLNPQAAFAHFTVGLTFIVEGKPKQALPEIENEPNEWGKLTVQAMAYHALGREQDSNAALAELIAKYGTDSAFQIAEVYAFRGETDKSFEWLEHGYQQRDTGLTILKTDPLLKNLHHDPRYAALLKKMRLPT